MRLSFTSLIIAPLMMGVLLASGCERIEFKTGEGRASKPVKKIAKQRFASPKIGTTALMTDYNKVTPQEIITRAHKAAGGLTWARPKTVSKEGYAIYYKDGKSLRHESHKMWRIYGDGGKVRIYSVKDDMPVINISYDGTVTYTDKGAQPITEADKGWSSRFGFGVIRHALDTAYELERLPDDLVDNQLAYTIRIYDPEGGETQFSIAQKDYKILKVGFETRRGWHERIYSDFYSNPDDDWVQPGRERLYYNGEKSNEIIWERYVINLDLPDCIFVLPQATNCS